MNRMDGKNVVVVGQLNSLPRGTVATYIDVLGGALRLRIDAETGLVIAGERAGTSLTRARAANLPVLREPELLAVLGLASDDHACALVRHAWDRIEAWLAEHAPPIFVALPEPLGADAAQGLNDTLAAPLPAALQASYERHNGASVIHGGLGWLSAQDMLELQSSRLAAVPTEVDAEPRVQPRFWSEMWLPIWSSGRGAVQAIDLSPGAGGRMGQIIDCLDDPPQRSVNADGFGLWLSAFARDLERGRYHFNGRELVSAHV